MTGIPPSDATAALRGWLATRRRVFVLTGAGISTGSGIPDYRDASGAWKRPAPVTYQAFVQHAATRARYWARAFVGWPRFSTSRPNAAHLALAAWQRDSGAASMLLTQNVDGLHQKAGSPDVVDLHGRLDHVRCLDCAHSLPREAVQDAMARANPDWRHLHARAGPDGDAELVDAVFEAFRVPSCPACGGMLKPDVVFFGETVPRDRVERAQAALQGSDGMLVVGSSLMVYSGFRFARMAHEAGVPLAILTLGVTRADALATLKLEADCLEVLPATLA